MENLKGLTALQIERVKAHKAYLLKCGYRTEAGRKKWFEIDLQDFIENVKNEPAEKSVRALKTVALYNSPEFEKWAQAEINKMDKAGMFSMANMKPINALD